MTKIKIIAAIGKNNELGKENELLWHIPEDLKYFKKETINKPIIVGRKTLDSFPGLLPKRLHLVLTSKKLEESDQLKTFDSKEKLLAYIKKFPEVMVVGGASIYKEFLDLADLLILTEIDEEKAADVYFPKFDKKKYDATIEGTYTFNDISYKRVIYRKK